MIKHVRNLLSTLLLCVLTMATSETFAQQYAVQVGAYQQPVSVNYFSDRGLDNVRADAKFNFIAYYYGSFSNQTDADVALADVLAKGFKYARVAGPDELNPNCPLECNKPTPPPALPPPPPQPTTIVNVAPLITTTPKAAPIVHVQVQIDNVFFDFDRSDLRSKSKADLDKLTVLMQENPLYKVEIHAHTDSKGSNAYNSDLSDRRKKAVVDYLVSNGLDRNRILDYAHGESQPIAKNELNGQDAPEGRQLNRRVELKVLEQQRLLDIVQDIFVPDYLKY